jgi:hypothetical protein
MIKLPSLPAILICSGCLLALVVGLIFRTTTLLGGMARFGFLPKGLTRWLYDVKVSKTTH